MDPSSVLDQTTQDVSNLQAEFHHILDEIRSADMQFYEQRKKCLQKDSQLHKYIRQHGSLTEHPKEDELSEKIREDFVSCKALQQEKCILANTALFLVSKHLAKLEKNIIILEEDGLLAPMEDEIDSGTEFSRENSVLSAIGERKRKGTSAGSATGPPSLKRRKQTRTSPFQQPQQQQDQQQHERKQIQPQSEDQLVGTPLPVVEGDSHFDLQDYNDDLFSGLNNNEEEDKTLYCFCQSVSYGEMVACDGANCRYEWFHYSCVNLKEPPKGAWFCPDCRQEMAKNKLKKKRI